MTGALSLIGAAVMFVLYPALRPWTDESTVDGASARSRPSRPISPMSAQTLLVPTSSATRTPSTTPYLR